MAFFESGTKGVLPVAINLVSPCLVEMWGGKGGHVERTQRSRSGYVAFWLPGGNKALFFTIAGGGGQADDVGFGGGGRAGGVRGFAGGGATTLEVYAPSLGINVGSSPKMVGIAAGGGGSPGEFSAGGMGGVTGSDGAGVTGTNVRGGGATETAHGATGSSPLNWFEGSQPGYLSGGDAAFPGGGDLFTGSGGGGGAGFKSGGGGGSTLSGSRWLSGGGGGGSNWVLDDHGIVLINSQNSTLRIGKITTHPLYHSSNFRSGHDGYVRVTIGSLASFQSLTPPALTLLTSSRTVAGQSLVLDATSTVGAESAPVKYLIDGVSESTADFVPKNVNLAVGEHTITAISTLNGATTSVSRMSTVYNVDFAVTSPKNVIVSAGTLVSISGHLIVTPTSPLDLTLTSRINGAGNGPVTVLPGGNFTLNYTPATAGEFTIELIAQLGETFTYFQTVEIIAQTDTTPKISVISPGEFSEVQHNQPLEILLSCFSQDPVPVDLTGDIVCDYNGFILTPNPVGSLTLIPSNYGGGTGSQSLTFYLTSDNSVSRTFDFTTFIAEINFVGMLPAYSVDDFTEIQVQTTSNVEYGGSSFLAPNYVKMYLDDSDTPFSFSGGTGVFPIPEAGEHTITALIFKRDIFIDPSFGAATLVEVVWSFTVLPSGKPQIYNTSATLVRALVESYQFLAESVSSDQAVSLTANQTWAVNGDLQPVTGESFLADNLVLGENIVSTTATDATTGKTTTNEFVIFASAAEAPCFAGDNVVELVDGRQVKLENLKAGMVLLDYLDQPIAITGLRKMESKSRHFIEISIPGFKHSLMLTKEHPILYQNAQIPARMVVGQPHVDVQVTQEPKALYHIETERKTFVQIQGVCVATVGRNEQIHE